MKGASKAGLSVSYPQKYIILRGVGSLLTCELCRSNLRRALEQSEPQAREKRWKSLEHEVRKPVASINQQSVRLGRLIGSPSRKVALW